MLFLKKKKAKPSEKRKKFASKSQMLK